MRTQLETLREPPLQPRLHPVVLAGSEGHDECGGSRTSELLQQRAADLIGADHLTRIDVQISELPDLPRGDVSRLGHKTQAELPLQQKFRIGGSLA